MKNVLIALLTATLGLGSTAALAAPKAAGSKTEQVQKPSAPKSTKKKSTKKKKKSRQAHRAQTHGMR